MTKDLDGDGKAERYGVGVEASLIRIAPFVWSNGGDVVDDEDEPTGFTLDSPEALDAMREFFKLHTVHGVRPGDEEVESEDDETRFQNGRMAMVLSSRRATRDSGRSPTSTGTSPRCRSSTSRRESSTRTPTA